MQSVSCTHGGPLEAEQAKHTAAGGCHNISEHHRELEVFGEYSSRSCIVVGYVSRFLEEPREDYLAVVKKILHYVTGTCNWGLWFDRKKGNQTLLTGFSDVDFAGDDVRKSTTGVIFFLANSPITWQSMKQKVVPQFSYESEYIAVANATCQELWLARVLAEVQSSALSTPLLRVDNKCSNGYELSAHCYCEFEAPCPINEASLRICHRHRL
jgi:hypothetical protein